MLRSDQVIICDHCLEIKPAKRVIINIIHSPGGPHWSNCNSKTPERRLDLCDDCEKRFMVKLKEIVNRFNTHEGTTGLERSKTPLAATKAVPQLPDTEVEGG